MKPSFVVVVLWVISFLYVSVIYLHAFFDASVDFRQHGLTISGATDDPERQLVALVIVLLIAYTVLNLFFDNGLYAVSYVVSLFMILMFVGVFGTLLTRVSWWSTMHYVFAVGAFICVVAMVVSMTPYCEPRAVGLLNAIVVSVIFFPAIQVRIASGRSSIAFDRVMAAAEFLALVCVAFQTFLYFRTNSV